MADSQQEKQIIQRRVERWHVGKEVSLIGLLAFVILIVTHIFTYGKYVQDAQNYREANDLRFSEYIRNSDEKFTEYIKRSDKRFAEHLADEEKSDRIMLSYINERTSDRIRAATVAEQFKAVEREFRVVEEKFNNRDIQIANMGGNLLDIKAAVSEITQYLRQLPNPSPSP